MADISAITGSIIKDAEAEAQSTIDIFKEKAENKAEKIRNETKTLLEKLRKDADRKNELEIKGFESEKRKIFENTISETRMNFYNQVIDEAKNLLRNSSSDIHLSFTLKTLEKLDIPDNSIISLSEKIADSDKDKICKKFNLKKGENIKDFGFIITSQSYRENYSLESIIEEKKADFIKFLHLRTEAK